MHEKLTSIPSAALSPSFSNGDAQEKFFTMSRIQKHLPIFFFSMRLVLDSCPMSDPATNAMNQSYFNRHGIEPTIHLATTLYRVLEVIALPKKKSEVGIV